MTALPFAAPLAPDFAAWPRPAAICVWTRPMSDEPALVRRARDGDQDAWRALIEQHERAVAAVVIGMMGPGDDADDVGQETFIRFYRSLATYRGDASVRTWLHRIAVNLSLNALKRRKRGLQRFLPFSVGDGPTPAAMQIDAVGHHDTRSTIETVQAAIARLSELHRAVVVLRLIEGYSTRETAEILGVPEGTILSRLARATVQLRLHLGPMMAPNQAEGRSDDRG